MKNPKRRLILLSLLLPAAWWLMQLVHESGHVLGAWITGGVVKRVYFHPLDISRTDLSHNPSPLVVVWAGPIGGVLLPLAAWLIAARFNIRGRHVLRFFAGFCLIGNGAYIAFGSFNRVGDCGTMLAHGAPGWTLWLFGLVTIPIGFRLWHNLGREFGLAAKSPPSQSPDPDH